MMNFWVYGIFLLTYALIASRRLSLLPIGRPAGALLGALLMVSSGVLRPEETYRAIDHDTILLLFGMMVLSVYFERAGFFQWLAGAILSRWRSPLALLWAASLLSGVLSAFFVNDTVCFFLTPIIVEVCIRARLPLGPYLIAVATSANIGSSATLVGNPQNMIIGSLSAIPFARFLMLAGPAAAAGLILNTLLLTGYYRRRLPALIAAQASLSVRIDFRRLTSVSIVIGGVLLGFLGGLHLGYTTLGGVMLLILGDRKDPRETFSRVDWPLLLFFSSLFIVVSGLSKTGIVEKAWGFSAPFMALAEAGGVALFTILMTIGSNVVSNVPLVMLTGPYLHQLGAHELGWVLLAFTTTVAGNLTLLGSVANIIVAERARDYYTLGFLEYLRFGLVSTVAVLAVGVLMIRGLMS
jgi:Na+/H+ antiporter NhaD/arsenite permease-like protein